MKKTCIIIFILVSITLYSSGQVNCILSFVDKNNTPVSGLVAALSAGKIAGRGEITNGKVVVSLAFSANYTGTLTLTVMTKERQTVNIYSLSSKATVSLGFPVKYIVLKTTQSLFLSGDGRVLSTSIGVIPVKLDYMQQLPKLKPPVFLPAPGTHNSFISITLDNKTPGSSTYYTTDSSIPDPLKATLYTEPFKLTDSCTIKALSVCKGWEDSDVVTGSYDFYFDTLPAPDISLNSGTYDSPREVTISCARDGVQLYYSTGASFIEYHGPLTMTDSVTLSAYAKKKYYGDSPVSQVQLTINKRDLTNKIISNPEMGTPEWVLWNLFDAADNNGFDIFTDLLCHEDCCNNQAAIDSLQRYNWPVLVRSVNNYMIDPPSYSFKIIRTVPSELSGTENEVCIFVYAGADKMPVPFQLKKSPDGNYKLTQL